MTRLAARTLAAANTPHESYLKYGRRMPLHRNREVDDRYLTDVRAAPIARTLVIEGKKPRIIHGSEVIGRVLEVTPGSVAIIDVEIRRGFEDLNFIAQGYIGTGKPWRFALRRIVSTLPSGEVA